MFFRSQEKEQEALKQVLKKCFTKFDYEVPIENVKRDCRDAMKEAIQEIEKTSPYLKDNSVIFWKAPSGFTSHGKLISWENARTGVEEGRKENSGTKYLAVQLSDLQIENLNNQALNKFNPFKK